jgi:hypothetical protein
MPVQHRRDDDADASAGHNAAFPRYGRKQLCQFLHMPLTKQARPWRKARLKPSQWTETAA